MWKIYWARSETSPRDRKSLPLAAAILLAGCGGPQTLAVANSGNNTVTEYTLPANGNIAPSATLGGSKTGINLPVALASDSVRSLRVGNFFACNNFNSFCGSITAYVAGATGNSAPVATIFGPNTGIGPGSDLSRIALDPAGNYYAIPGSGSPQVLVYDRGATGNQAPIAIIAGGNTGLAWPRGIAVDQAGKIYVTNMGNPQSVTVYASGSSGNVAPISTILDAQEPIGVAVDAAGAIYVANFFQPSVVVYPAGANGQAPPQRTIIGGNTGLEGAAVTGIAVDASGDIYVSIERNAVAPSEILVYGPNANGNVAPDAVISGAATGLSRPIGLTVLPAQSH